MAMVDLHPSELAYAFAYSNTREVIGWGIEPFLPAGEGDGDPAGWTLQGEERLVAGGLLVGSPEEGLSFTPEMASAILTLADPGLVLLAQRKAGDDVRTLTIHVAGDNRVGLVRREDGIFELARYADLTAAAGACAGFVGAAMAPPDPEVRLETDHPTLLKLKRLAGEGDRAVDLLMRSGASAPDAASASLALAQPTASGVLSVLYCANNIIEDAETYGVFTNSNDHTWITFSPAGPDGPMIFERSTLSGLAARVSVGIAARLTLPSQALDRP